MGNEILYSVWLAQKLGAGSRYFREIIERFGSAFEVYRADEDEIIGENRDSRPWQRALCDKNLEEAMTICRSCERLGVDIIDYNDERYPARLRAIPNPPVVLYSRGKIPNFDRLLCVGVVGTRKMTEYGCRSAYKISYELAAAGIVTVSGMALGIDSVVACATFAAKGHTVAVLGSGIDVVYPSAHRKIYNEILKNGTVISEYPPGMRPTRYSFPLRNRIISGLSQGVFVVEGDMNSGAMITAKDALVQGRELFALPGNVGEDNANGTNSMIRDGAHPVISSADIIEEFRPLYNSVINVDALKRIGNASEYNPSVLAYYCVLPQFSADGKRVGVINTDGEKSKTTAKRGFEKEKTEVTPTVKNEKTVKKTDDGSRAAYASLSPDLLAVYEKLPADNGAVSLDRIASGGLGVGEVMAALTLLELQGLVVSLPGGMYART